ncbi:hypothetical protein ACEPAG_3488 [Sanghuangporus baumii]
MGQKPSTPSERWPYFLNFTSGKYKIDNNTLTCEELGIRYRIYTPPVTRIFTLTDDRITSIYRLDPKTQREILIAEVEKRSHKRRVRIAPGTGLDVPGLEAPFVRMKEYFPNTSRSGIKRIFRASNGKDYIWKIYDGKLYRSDDKSEPIAEYGHASAFGSTPMRIMFTNECLDILDEVVVTCLLSEQKRRDLQDQNAAAGAASASSAAGAAAAAAVG